MVAWYRSRTVKDHKVLGWDDGTAEHIIGRQLPAPQDVLRPPQRPQVGSQDYYGLLPPSSSPFTLLPSGRRYCSVWSRSDGLKDSLYHASDHKRAELELEVVLDLDTLSHLLIYSFEPFSLPWVVHASYLSVRFCDLIYRCITCCSGVSCALR